MSEPEMNELAGLNFDWDTLKKAIDLLTSDEVLEVLEKIAEMVESGNATTRYQKAVLGCLIVMIALQAATIVLLLQ